MLHNREAINKEFWNIFFLYWKKFTLAWSSAVVSVAYNNVGSHANKTVNITWREYKTDESIYCRSILNPYRLFKKNQLNELFEINILIKNILNCTKN